MDREISIHAPRAGRDEATEGLLAAVRISIHAPRAGRDTRPFAASPPPVHFNPRAPCGARRSCAACGRISSVFQSTRPVRGATTIQGNGQTVVCSFQSTRPVRGATLHSSKLENMTIFQSTRPVRGATLICWPCVLNLSISIHAPRAGRDDCFQSSGFFKCISIHAPRAGRDNLLPEQLTAKGNFNPRAPCGARHDLFAMLSETITFQSTRPVRGATIRGILSRAPVDISIHAPRAGRDH